MGAVLVEVAVTRKSSWEPSGSANGLGSPSPYEENGLYFEPMFGRMTTKPTTTRKRVPTTGTRRVGGVCALGA